MNTTTVTVKNNTIILPEIIGKKLENREVILNESGTTITFHIVPVKKQTSPKDLEAWSKLKGMLKGRVTIDPVKWQRTIRKEWDKKLP